MPFTPLWIFIVLGPLFLVLGFARTLSAGSVVPQAKTWLVLGVLFSLVAAWLWFAKPPGV